MSSFTRDLLAATVALPLMSPALVAEEASAPISNVAGKKLIRVSQALVNFTPVTEVPGKVDAWQLPVGALARQG